MNVDMLRTVLLLRRGINDTPGSAHTSSAFSVTPNFRLSSNTSINSHETHHCCDPKTSCQERFMASFEKNMATWCLCRC